METSTKTITIIITLQKGIDLNWHGYANNHDVAIDLSMALVNELLNLGSNRAAVVEYINLLASKLTRREDETNA